MVDAPNYIQQCRDGEIDDIDFGELNCEDGCRGTLGSITFKCFQVDFIGDGMIGEGYFTSTLRPRRTRFFDAR